MPYRLTTERASLRQATSISTDTSVDQLSLPPPQSIQHQLPAHGSGTRGPPQILLEIGLGFRRQIVIEFTIHGLSLSQ